VKIQRGRNSQLTRALQLIERLKGQRATLIELSQDFGVTTRTIRRDLEAISAAGIPLQSTDESGGFWFVSR